MFFPILFVLLISSYSAFCEEFQDDSDFALKYLQQYNYLSTTRSGNHNIGKAIKNFQKFFALPVTGELDEATLEQMKKPRCGVPDVDNNGRVKRRSSYKRWRQSTFKYFLYKGEDMPESEQKRIIAKAFKIWSDAVRSLRFIPTSSTRDADLKLSFGKTRHSGTPYEPLCTTVFDGKGGMLAHAFPPRDGRIHFDDDEYFTEKGSMWNRSQGLLYNAVHEIGHALGLHHSILKNSVMWPKPKRGVPKLIREDIDAMRYLFPKD